MVGSMHGFVKGSVSLPHADPFIDCPKHRVIACKITLPGFRVVAFASRRSNSRLIRTELKTRIRGAVAQLGARVNGIHEVAGSIPASSTTPHFVWAGRFFESYRKLNATG